MPGDEEFALVGDVVREPFELQPFGRVGVGHGLGCNRRVNLEQAQVVGGELS